MKVLLISYLFPPLWEAQSVRWYYLAKELAKMGANIDVLTIFLPFEEKLDLSNNINTIRIPPGPFESILFKVKFKLEIENNKNTSNKKNPVLRTTFLFKSLKTIYHINRKILGSLLLGEIRNEWFFKAKKWIDQNNLNSYQVIITSHEPMVDTLLGLYIKKKYPHLLWLADLGDPLTAPYYPFFWKPVLKKIEKEILKKADIVTITNRRLKEKYLSQYKINPQKILIIPQGFDWNFYLNQNNNLSQNPVFTLFYAGSFYKKFRDPTELFRALEEFPYDFRFYLAGRIEKFLPKSSKLKDKIIYLGVLPHKEVLNWEKKANLLIYIANALEDQISGKFFEYLGSKNPILCITQNPQFDDEILSLINNLNIGKTVHNKKEKILKALLEFYEKFVNNKLNLNHYNTNLLYKFSWQYYAQKIYKYLITLL